jgi:hypothetical protein
MDWDCPCVGNLLIVFSLVPLALLLFTLANRERLEVQMKSPMVIALAAAFVVLLVVGIYIAFIR